MTHMQEGMTNSDIYRLFYRAQLLLEEGESQSAATILQTIITEDPTYQHEKDYLLGWYYIQQKSWDQAAHVLQPLCENSNEAGSETEASLKRSALCWLRWGHAAINCSLYEDASRYYQKCLTWLQGQHASLRSIRMAAFCGHGAASAKCGLYEAAALSLEEALGLRREGRDRETLAGVYHSLCYTYRHCGKFIEAWEAGQNALALYEQMGNDVMQGRMYTLLGRISFMLGDCDEAASYYGEALSIAMHYRSCYLSMITYTDLADLRLAERRLPEAWGAIQFALKSAQSVEDKHTRSQVYLVAGKLAVAEAEQQTIASRLRIACLEEASSYFEQASELLKQTQAHATIAELYGRWARVMEELGQLHKASMYWRRAYEAIAAPKGAVWC